MNILVVSATFGAGHHRAAQALQQAAATYFPGLDVYVVDFLDEQNSRFNMMVKQAYLGMLTAFPDLYELLYQYSQKAGGQKVVDLTGKILREELERLVGRYRPELLMFTHPFPGAAAAILKRQYRISCTLAAVVTDFSIHRFWLHNEVDLYFVATEDLKNALIHKGVEARRIFATGIPITPEFATVPSPMTAKAQWGLTGCPAIVVMGGGFGLGPLERVLMELNGVQQALNIVVVAGRNSELKTKLEKLAASSPHSVKILGYTHDIASLMAAADLIVTKPGGLTLSEALARGLPIVITGALPGQEEENAAYLEQKGVAIRANNAEELSEVISQLLLSPGQLAKMRSQGRRLANPFAATDIIALCLEQAGRLNASRS